MTEQHTVTLQDGIDALNDAMEQLEETADELQEELDKLFDEGEIEEPIDASETDRGQSITDGYKRCKKRREELAQKQNDWGENAAFVFEDLSYGAMLGISDKVRDKSFEVGEDGRVRGIGKEGVHRIEFLRAAVKEMPAGAPDDPANLDYQIGHWLYDHIDDALTAEGVDSGNLWSGQE